MHVVNIKDIKVRKYQNVLFDYVIRFYVVNIKSPNDDLSWVSRPVSHVYLYYSF